jgi:hypothetical protein
VPEVATSGTLYSDVQFDAAAKLSELMLRNLKGSAGLEGSLAATRFPGPAATGARPALLLL